MRHEEVEEWLRSVGEERLIQVYRERLGISDDEG
jgi:hypothetical protein